jgi:hypothetical protein
MKAYLEIELIGDNVVQVGRLYKNITDSIIPGLGSMTFDIPPSGWVAEITGYDSVYKYKRSFLRYKKDYSRANSKGSRGVYAEYTLESGKIYDVKNNKQRYFCRVDEDGDIIHIEESEVREWLKNILGLMSSQPQENE